MEYAELVLPKSHGVGTTYGLYGSLNGPPVPKLPLTVSHAFLVGAHWAWAFPLMFTPPGVPVKKVIFPMDSTSPLTVIPPLPLNEMPSPPQPLPSAKSAGPAGFFFPIATTVSVFEGNPSILAKKRG